MEKLIENVSQQVGTHLPGILSAVAILVIGWLVAVIVSRIIKAALKKSGMGAKLSNAISADGSVDSTAVIGKFSFYGIMAFVLIAFFNALNLPVVSKPLDAMMAQVFEYAPRIISAGVLGLIAYILARIGRDLSKKGLEAADIDSRLSSFGSDAAAASSSFSSAATLPQDDELDFGADSAEFSQPVEAVGDDSVKLSQTLPEAVYWLVFALFLPAILGALQMPGLLEPVQDMFTKMFNYFPNIIGAAVILLIGSFIAKIVRQVASNLTASVGVNKIASKIGMGSSSTKPSDVLGLVVYAMILLPVTVAALNTLDIEAITKPASDILAKLTSLIPGFIGAGVVLGIAFFIGKMVADLVENLLEGVGFDSVPEKLGLNLSNASESSTPSKIGGKLVLVSIVLLSLMQALPMMGLESLAGHVEAFSGVASQVLVGLVILAMGMFLANFVGKMIKDSGIENAGKMAMVAKIAILVFAGGFGLQQMGLSASIVNVAFGSILGGLGLAAAIAFGWGGRDAAKRILDRAVK